MDKHQVLCVYGIEDLQEYRKWAETKDHYLIFLEDDPNIDDLESPFANSSNVEIRSIASEKKIPKILKEIAWKFLFLEIDLKCSKKYQISKKAQFTYIKNQFDFMVRGVHLSASYFSDHGLKSFFNIYSNLFKNRSLQCLKNREGIFSQIPIIICGAGPSLNEAIPILKEIKDQVLIFAGGTALTILQNHNITPHLMANIDPIAPKMKLSKGTPYFFPWKVSKENLRGNIYPKILCSAKEPYLFDQWLEQELNLSFDRLDMGWTVTTFMTSLAIYFGCDPIIFVGNDLAIEKDQIYGNKAGPKSIQKKQKQSYILSEGKHTQKDWAMAAQWFRKVVENHKHLSFFKSSKRGLSLGDRVSDLDLSKVLRYPSLPLKEKIRALYVDLPIFDLSIKSSFSTIYHQVVDRLALCNQRVEQLEDCWNHQKYEIENAKITSNWCDQYLLDPLWEIFKHVYVRNIDKDPFFKFKLELYKTLFFKDVLKEHKKIIKRFYESLQISHSR